MDDIDFPIEDTTVDIKQEADDYDMPESLLEVSNLTAVCDSEFTPTKSSNLGNGFSGI